MPQFQGSMMLARFLPNNLEKNWQIVSDKDDRDFGFKKLRFFHRKSVN
jgi:hypothetical protein